jgi:hypothetical protein
MTFIRRLVVLASMVAAVGSARAQAIEAEAMFSEGKRLMKEGRIGEACEKFEISDRLESSVGTLLNLGNCREKNGQLATAWVAFRKAASLARQVANDPKRSAEARRRAAALEPRLAYLTVAVPAASRIDGLKLARDGALIDAALWNQRVPVDAGTYEITGDAPTYERWSTRVEITAEGQNATVRVPRLGPSAEPTRAAAPSLAPTPTQDVAVKDDDDGDDPIEPAPRRGTLAKTRVLSVTLAVAALGGVAGALVLGKRANDLEAQSDALCPTSTCNGASTAQPAIQLNAEARHDVRLANACYIASGAALAGAVVLWFVGRPSVERKLAIAPTIGRGGTGIALEGWF